MQLTGVLLLVLVKRFQSLGWLAELVQFAAYGVYRVARREHSRIPAYPVQPPWHMRIAEQYSFAAQPSRIVILEVAFESAVDEQIRAT
jgi:hypothetical protein